MENQESRRDILKLSGKTIAALGGAAASAGCTEQDVTIEDLAQDGGNSEYLGRDVLVEGWLQYIDSEREVRTRGGLQGVTYRYYFDHFYKLHSEENKDSSFIYLVDNEFSGEVKPYGDPEPEPFGNLDKGELYNKEVNVKGVYTMENILEESEKPSIPNVGYIRD